MAKKSINLFLGLNDKDFQKKMKGVQKRLNKVGSSMKSTGRSLTTSLTAPLLGIGAIAGKTFMDFEQAMLKVKAISGATGQEFAALEANAKKLGSSTMFTASQVAGLQLELSKLGLTPTQINNSTESILNLAQATDSDLSQSAEVAAKTMQAFGLEATEMTRIADVMADAFSSSALDMGKFETAMGTVAPVARGAGADLEQTTAILGVLVNNGVEASTAGTALRNIFLDLSKEGKTMGEAMDEINNSTNPLTTAMEMFGKRGATVATILANNGQEIQNLTDDFRESEGEALAMAKIMDSGLGGAMRKLTSQIEGVAIQLGEILLPIFSKIVGLISGAIESFTSLDSKTKNIIVTLGILAASIGPIISLVGFLTTAFAVLSGPVGVAIGVIAALGTALIYASDNWEAIKERFSDISWWKNALISILQFFVKYNPFSALIEGYNAIVGLFGKDELKADNLFMDLADSLEDLKVETKEYQNEFGSFGDAISNTVDKVKGKLGELSGKMGLGGGVASSSTPTTPTAAPVQGQMGPMALPEGMFDSLGEEQKGFFNKSEEEWTEWADNGEKNLQRFQDTFGATFNQIGAILTQHTANQKETLQQETNAQLEELDSQHKQNIEAIENSVMSEEAKNSALEKAEKDYQDKKTGIEEKAAKEQAKLARRQAKIDKAQSALGIIVNTASAVMKSVAASPLTGGLPWSAAAAALGAVQLGTVLAAPLPALAKGGLAYGETTAIVGDNPRAKVDPEVIAPLSKLQNMMGGAREVIVTGKILGEDIYLSNERYMKRLNSFS